MKDVILYSLMLAAAIAVIGVMMGRRKPPAARKPKSQDRQMSVEEATRRTKEIMESARAKQDAPNTNATSRQETQWNLKWWER